MTKWYDYIFKDQKTADEWNPKIDAWRTQYLGTHVEQTVSKLSVIDLDKLYYENIRQGAVDVPCGQDDECIAMDGSVDEIKKILFQSSDENLNFIASCKCGHLKGNYNLGQICPECKSEVRTAFADEINIHAWLSVPESLPPFLHPAVYRILDKWMGSVKRKASLLDSILNVDADLPEPYLTAFGRGGMWYFHQNFWDIINFVAAQRKGIKAKDNEPIFRFLEMYKDRLFCRHIPILNQSLHILTHSGSMTYNDTSSKFILKACLEMSNTIYHQRHQAVLNRNYLDQQVFATYKAWIDYTNSIIKDKIQGKTGFIRKCILGARIHCSARGVIVPITNTHMADEIELPWRMVVGLYKLEIINRLVKNYGYDPNTALEYWTQAQVGIREDEPDPMVRQRVLGKMNAVKLCIDELLAECPYKGFPVTLGRNPTLRQGENKGSLCRAICIANTLNCWQSLKLSCLETGTKVETSREMTYGQILSAA